MPGLFFDSGVDKGFEKDIQRMKKEMRSLGGTVQKEGTVIDKTFTNIGRNLATFISVAAIGAAGKELITFTKDLESALTEVATISSTITDDFEGYRQAILELSTDEERGAEGAIKLTEALYQIVSAGFDGEQGLKLLSEAALASTAGFVETAIAADGLTTVLNAWGKSADEAGLVSDIFFKTVEKGKTTFSELGKNINQVAPIAASMGVSFEEVAAASATLTKAGTPTAQAMTQIRASLIAMNEVLGDGWAEVMTYQEALIQLKEQAGGSQNQLTKMLGRVEAVNAVLGLTGKNALTAAEDLEAMNNALGATEAAAAKVVDTTANQLNVLKNNILAALEPLGTEASGVIADLAKSLNEAFKSGDIQKYTKILVQLAKAFVVYKVSLIAVNQLQKLNIIQTRLLASTGVRASKTTLLMASANKTLTRSFKSLKLAFATNPIGLLITGLTLAIPLIDSFINKQDELTAKQSFAEKVAQENNETLAKQVTELDSLFFQLKKTNSGTEDRARLIKTINDKYGTTLQNLENEEAFLKQIDEAYLSIVNNMKKKLALEAQGKVLQKLIEKEILGKELLLGVTKELAELEKARLSGGFFNKQRFDLLTKQAEGYKGTLKEVVQAQEDLVENTSEIISDLTLATKDPVKLITEEERKKQLKELQALLNNQRKVYEQYNNDIEGLSGERLEIVEDEYAALTDQGKTYLKFLEKLLAEEKNVQKQAVIKREIVTVTSEQNIQEQKKTQQALDDQEKELEKLLAQYSSYIKKREQLISDFGDKAAKLRTQGYEDEAQQAEKALQDELIRLDESIAFADSKFKQWLKTSLPKLAKDGITALKKELDKLELDIEAGGLDPEQVAIYQTKIRELNKQLENKVELESDSEESWKDTLEIINGVNELTKNLISNFEGLDDVTKAILTNIVNISSGIINLVKGLKAANIALKTLDKASAILAVISAAFQIFNAISRLFTARAEKEKKAAERRKQALLEELDLIQSTNIALIQQNALYEEGNELFTSDRWGKALAGLEAYNLALEFQKDALLEIKNIKIFEGDPKIAASLQRSRAGMEDLLSLYPDLIDAYGNVDGAILQTILNTAALSDEDRKRLENLKGLLSEAEAAYSQFGDFIASIFGGVADDITQAFQTMFETGDDAMEALQESFSDMIESFTRDAIKFAFLQPYLDELNERTKALGEQFAKGEITGEQLQAGVIDSLGDFYEKLNTLQPFILEAFKEADIRAAEAGFEDAFNIVVEDIPVIETEEVEPPEIEPVSVAGQIQQAITEETGSVLVGRMGAIMQSNERIANFSADALEFAVQNLVYLKQIKLNTDSLPAIEENTRKTFEKLESI